MLSAFTEDSDSGDETVFVKNLDTGEDEDVEKYETVGNSR